MVDITIEQEKMNDVFTKHHLRGLPFDAVIHHFSEKDKNEHIHDHPFGFTSHVLKGGYIERVYTIDYENKTWSVEEIYRMEGDSHFVPANTIHEIIALPRGECFTIITPQPREQEVSFYRFGEEGMFKRQWNETEFKKL